MKNGIRIESNSNQNTLRVIQHGSLDLRGKMCIFSLTGNFEHEKRVIENSTSYSCDISNCGVYEIYCGFKKSTNKTVSVFIKVSMIDGQLNYAIISKKELKSCFAA